VFVLYDCQNISLRKPLYPRSDLPVSLSKAKSCSSILHMLLVCFCSYLKSDLRHKFLILEPSHPATVYIREQGREDAGPTNRVV